MGIVGGRMDLADLQSRLRTSWSQTIKNQTLPTFSKIQKWTNILPIQINCIEHISFHFPRSLYTFSNRFSSFTGPREPSALITKVVSYLKEFRVVLISVQSCCLFDANHCSIFETSYFSIQSKLLLTEYFKGWFSNKNSVI